MPSWIVVSGATVALVVLLWGTIAVASRVPKEVPLRGASNSNALQYAPEARTVAPLRSSFLEARLGGVLGGTSSPAIGPTAAGAGSGQRAGHESTPRMRDNDRFADAQEFHPPNGSDRRDLSDASLENGEPQACGSVSNTVWYRFSPDRRVRASLDNVGSEVETVIAAYAGAELDDLHLVGCTTGTNAGLGFTAEGGSVYHFQIGLPPDASRSPSEDSNLVVNFEAAELPPPPPPPDNDDFAAPTRIDALPFGGRVDAASATVEQGEPMPSCRRPAAHVGETVWYRITPPEDGLLLAEASGYDTIVAVYTGNTLGSLREVACNGLSSAPGRSTAAFSASKGVTYTIQAGAEDGEAGLLDFRVCRGEKLGGCGQ